MASISLICIPPRLHISLDIPNPRRPWTPTLQNWWSIDHGSARIHHDTGWTDKQHHQFKPCTLAARYGHCSIAFHKQRHRGYHHVAHSSSRTRRNQDGTGFSAGKAHGLGHSVARGTESPYQAAKTILEILLFYLAAVLSKHHISNVIGKRNADVVLFNRISP